MINIRQTNSYIGSTKLCCEETYAEDWTKEELSWTKLHTVGRDMMNLAKEIGKSR